jgi:hypothetical protein
MGVAQPVASGDAAIIEQLGQRVNGSALDHASDLSDVGVVVQARLMRHRS